jgi:hypothetical protein
VIKEKNRARRKWPHSAAETVPLETGTAVTAARLVEHSHLEAMPLSSSSIKVFMHWRSLPPLACLARTWAPRWA